MNWFTRRACGLGIGLGLLACLFVSLLQPASLLAQASNAAAISGGPIVTPYGTIAAGAPIRVCLITSIGTPCSTAGVSLYSDANLTQPLSNPAALTSQGLYAFFTTSPGYYIIQVQATPAAIYTYYYFAVAGGGGITGSGTPNYATTWTGTTSIGNAQSTDGTANVQYSPSTSNLNVAFNLNNGALDVNANSGADFNLNGGSDTGALDVNTGSGGFGFNTSNNGPFDVSVAGNGNIVLNNNAGSGAFDVNTGTNGVSINAAGGGIFISNNDSSGISLNANSGTVTLKGSGITAGNSPVCPNGTGGALTNSGCSGSGYPGVTSPGTGGLAGNPGSGQTWEITPAGGFEGTGLSVANFQTYTMTGNTANDLAAINTALAAGNTYLKILPQSASVGGTLTGIVVLYSNDTIDTTALSAANLLAHNFSGTFSSFTGAYENEAYVSPTTLFSGTCTLAQAGSAPQYYQQATCSTGAFATGTDTGQSFDCTNAMGSSLNLDTTIAYVASSTVIQLAAPNQNWDAGAMYASGSYTCTETKRDVNIHIYRGYETLDDTSITGYGPVDVFLRDCNQCEIAQGTVVNLSNNWHDVVEGVTGFKAHDIFYQSGSGSGTDGLNVEGPAEATYINNIGADIGDDAVTAKDGEPDGVGVGDPPLGGKWGENTGEHIGFVYGSGGSAGVHIYGQCINGSGGGSCIAAPTDNWKVDNVVGLPESTAGNPATNGFSNGVYVQEGLKNASAFAGWPVVTHGQIGAVQGVVNGNYYAIGSSTSTSGQEYGDISITGMQPNPAAINSGVQAALLVYGAGTVDSLSLAASAYTGSAPLLICSGASNPTITNLYSDNTNPSNVNLSNCNVTNKWIPGSVGSGAANDMTVYTGTNSIGPAAVTGIAYVSTAAAPRAATGADIEGLVQTGSGCNVNTTPSSVYYPYNGTCGVYELFGGSGTAGSGNYTPLSISGASYGTTYMLTDYESYLNAWAMPDNAAVVGTGANGQITTTTATQVSGLVQGLTGCGTSGYVFTPEGNDCVAQSGGSAPTLETNGSNNSSQATLNLISSSTNAAGLTLTQTNTTGGTVQGEIAGTVNATHGGTGTTSLTGVRFANGGSADTAATAAQIVTVIGSTAVQNATTAVNLSGTATDSIPYQSASATTSYLNPCLIMASVPCFLTETPTSGPTAASPSWSLSGIPGRTVTGTTDTIAATDRSSTILYNSSSAVAVTLTSAATLSSNFSFAMTNENTGTVTLTAATGTIYPQNSTTLVVAEGQNCALSTPDNTNWVARCSSGLITAGSNIILTQSATGTAVAVAASPSFTNLTVTGTPTFSGIEGASTYCLQISSSGVLSNTGSACGSGGGGGTNVQVNGGSTLTTANLSNTTGLTGVAVTNPSGSTVNFNLAATVNGSGGGLVSGPTSSTNNDCAKFTGTSGQIADSGSGCGGAPTFPVNAQTANYQALASDFSSCKTITYASSTSYTITLVASGSQPSNGQCIMVINYGAGTPSIAPSGQNLNGGSSSVVVPAGSATAPTGAFVVSDGTNYEAYITGSAAGSGMVGATATSVTLTATTYMPITGGGLSSTTLANTQMAAPGAATLSNFFVQVTSAPGTGNTLVATVMLAGAATSITCTIPAAGTSCSDTTHTLNVTQGQLLNIQLAPTGTVVVTPNVLTSIQWTSGSSSASSSNYYQSPWFGTTGVTLSPSSANTIRGIGFVPTSNITFSNIYVSSQTADSSNLYSVAIANGSTGALVCHPTTGQHVPTADTLMTNTCSEGTVTLTAGTVYVLLTTGNSTTGEIFGVAGGTYLPSPYLSTAVSGCTSSSGVLSGTCSFSIAIQVGNVALPQFYLH